MALVQCPECESEVSNTAYECPKCGKVLRKPSRGVLGKFILFMFWVFMLLMPILFGVAYWSASSQETIGAGLIAGVGLYFLGGIWITLFFVLGLLVLLTRPRR